MSGGSQALVFLQRVGGRLTVGRFCAANPRSTTSAISTSVPAVGGSAGDVRGRSAGCYERSSSSITPAMTCPPLGICRHAQCETTPT
jgi:hypothetical protein